MMKLCIAELFLSPSTYSASRFLLSTFLKTYSLNLNICSTVSISMNHFSYPITVRNFNLISIYSFFILLIIVSYFYLIYNCMLFLPNALFALLIYVCSFFTLLITVNSFYHTYNCMLLLSYL